jgi:VWFA-related protein
VKRTAVAGILLIAACLPGPHALGAPKRTVALQRVDLSRLPVVDVYVTVTDDRGQSVLGLTDREVSVAIDTEPQAVTSFASAISGGEHLSVALLFDRSGSMKTAIGRTKDAALEFVRRLSRDDRLAVVSFDDKVRIDSPFSSDRAALESAIRGIATGTDTALYDAIRLALDLLASERTKRQAIVVLSDGKDTKSTRLADEVLADTKRSGVPIYTFGLGDAINAAVLARLASETGGASATAREADELRLLYQRIADELSNQYILAFTSSFGQDGAWRRLRVEVKDAGSGKASAERPFIATRGPGVSRELVSSLERRAGRRTLGLEAALWAAAGLGIGILFLLFIRLARRDVSLRSPLAIAIVILSGVIGGISGIVMGSLWR